MAKKFLKSRKNSKYESDINVQKWKSKLNNKAKASKALIPYVRHLSMFLITMKHEKKKKKKKTEMRKNTRSGVYLWPLSFFMSDIVEDEVDSK